MQEFKLETVETMEEILPFIKEILALGKSVRLYPRGTSMLPMLRQGKDSVVLSPFSGNLKKYEIPLYQRDHGKCFLHRIIDAGNTYICMGDNQFTPEPGIRQEQILAVVTAFYRGERRVSLRSPGYWFYCRIWYASRGLRKFLKRGMGWLRRRLK